ncbi:hypothetical protein [Martelella sp. HB161492]|nr:hypothetical protein [Martelella sp. HB161492]
MTFVLSIVAGTVVYSGVRGYMNIARREDQIRSRMAPPDQQH